MLSGRLGRFLGFELNEAVASAGSWLLGDLKDVLQKSSGCFTISFKVNLSSTSI